VTKELTVAELAADLPAHVASVKNGETLTIVENGTPIAEISPTLIRKGVQYPFRDFNFGERPKGLHSDPADIIIEEREYERSGKKLGF
jgi:antitoxin (DNA-binding transcriptional repressor) of toxin-antitoxin stability system